MGTYVLRRLLWMIPTLFGAGILVFCLMRLVPGDICDIKLAGEGASVAEDQFEICREELGLNKSIVAQFGDFVIGMVMSKPNSQAS